MPRFEYSVVPAPTKGQKAKGVKGPEARFAHALSELMNRMASEGWEYQRAETLPSIERAGLTSTTTEWRNVLVFRRLRENDADAFSPELLPPPDAVSIPAEAQPDPASGRAEKEDGAPDTEAEAGDISEGAKTDTYAENPPKKGAKTDA